MSAPIPNDKLRAEVCQALLAIERQVSWLRGALSITDRDLAEARKAVARPDVQSTIRRLQEAESENSRLFAEQHRARAITVEKPGSDNQ
jgi:hypothetical protein